MEWWLTGPHGWRLTVKVRGEISTLDHKQGACARMENPTLAMGNTQGEAPLIQRLNGGLE